MGETVQVYDFWSKVNQVAKQTPQIARSIPGEKVNPLHPYFKSYMRYVGDNDQYGRLFLILWEFAHHEVAGIDDADAANALIGSWRQESYADKIVRDNFGSCLVPVGLANKVEMLATIFGYYSLPG